MDGRKFLHIGKDSADILLRCTEGKLFRVTHPDYPDSDAERQEAVRKAETKIGEELYQAHSRNCEHLLNEILLKVAYCSQIMDEGQKLKADSLQMLSKAPGRFLATFAENISRLGLKALRYQNQWLKRVFEKGILPSAVDDTFESLLNSFVFIEDVPWSPWGRVFKDTAWALICELLLFCWENSRQLSKLKLATPREETLEFVAGDIVERFLEMLGGLVGCAAGGAAVALAGLSAGFSLLFTFVGLMVGHFVVKCIPKGELTRRLRVKLVEKLRTLIEGDGYLPSVQVTIYVVTASIQIVCEAAYLRISEFMEWLFSSTSTAVRQLALPMAQ